MIRRETPGDRIVRSVLVAPASVPVFSGTLPSSFRRSFLECGESRVARDGSPASSAGSPHPTGIRNLISAVEHSAAFQLLLGAAYPTCRLTQFLCGSSPKRKDGTGYLPGCTRPAVSLGAIRLRSLPSPRRISLTFQTSDHSLSFSKSFRLANGLYPAEASRSPGRVGSS